MYTPTLGPPHAKLISLPTFSMSVMPTCQVAVPCACDQPVSHPCTLASQSVSHASTSAPHDHGHKPTSCMGHHLHCTAPPSKSAIIINQPKETAPGSCYCRATATELQLGSRAMHRMKRPCWNASCQVGCERVQRSSTVRWHQRTPQLVVPTHSRFDVKL